MKKNTGELLLGSMVFTLIISVMGANMFNVVLPTISKEFYLTPSQVSWMITGYMIVYAIGSVTYGKLSERYSLKGLLTFGLLLFAIGSIAGLVAIEYWMVIAGRIVQAAGASTAAIGKVLDYGTSAVRINPIPHNSTTFVYSNIFLTLAVLIVAMATLYYVQFGRAAKMIKGDKMDSKTVA
ncbi:Major Facilitator Superfamily protein [Paenibacillus sp. BC26]|nr:MFS transporter [Paenibacillus sp. BC26]SFS66435.1 Major Facilitator Superfamily protein [Paenibacillus sp. BC26]